MRVQQLCNEVPNTQAWRTTFGTLPPPAKSALYTDYWTSLTPAHQQAHHQAFSANTTREREAVVQAGLETYMPRLAARDRVSRYVADALVDAWGNDTRVDFNRSNIGATAWLESLTTKQVFSLRGAGRDLVSVAASFGAPFIDLQRTPTMLFGAALTAAAMGHIPTQTWAPVIPLRATGLAAVPEAPEPLAPHRAIFTRQAAGEFAALAHEDQVQISHFLHDADSEHGKLQWMRSNGVRHMRAINSVRAYQVFSGLGSLALMYAYDQGQIYVLTVGSHATVQGHVRAPRWRANVPAMLRTVRT